jgi:hypothetical protein
MLLGVLAALALAIDLGMLFTARAEAQRAADAAALAAASAFQEFDPALAVAPARARAFEYAEKNHIRGALITAPEVTVQVETDKRLVRVWVRRDSLPTWFARLVGVPFAPVGAMAAQASEGGSAKCLKPFALPDIWYDADNDANGNRLWDQGEGWSFDQSQGDRYLPYTGPDGSPDETGYGSAWRDSYDPSGVKGDYGREIQLKYTDPNSDFVLAPSMFLPWRLPTDSDQPECTFGGGSGDTGAAVYRRNICSCNASSVQLGTPYDIEPGNMLGPTAQGVKELIDEDPGARWSPSANSGQGAVENSAWGDNWLSSPRVVRVAMFDPTQVITSGMQSITFNNFGLFFIEQQLSSKDPVVGRFLYYVDGDGQGPGPTKGSLVLVLRLVE